MIVDTIAIRSKWGVELQPMLFRNPEGNGKLAVMFPGRNYPSHMPILYYAGQAARQVGCDLLALEYGYFVARQVFDPNELPAVVAESQAAIAQVAQSYDRIAFISKSMGTQVAGAAHEGLGLPVRHIFLTPLREALPYINRTENLVVYGTNDPLFDATAAKAIEVADNRTTIRIERADHALETGDVVADIAIQGRLAASYKDFLI